MTAHATMPSPVGELLLVASDDGLVAIRFERNRHGDDPRASSVPSSEASDAAARVLADARSQLDAYFAGALTEFDLPLDPRGTPFQQKVWTALREIPFGQTISYAELARRTGDPKAVRAVGAANGRNPLPLVVPCHRVIGADGSLVGFGGGLERKRWLLRHEGAQQSLDLDVTPAIGTPGAIRR
jgi:methylated-DNA-[protein]-cysteine S-methyltransferase